MSPMKRALKMREQGMGEFSIGRELNVPRGIVRERLKKYDELMACGDIAAAKQVNLDKRQTGATPDQHKRIAEMLLAGMSLHKCSEAVGISVWSVAEVGKKEGIPAKHPGRQKAAPAVEDKPKVDPLWSAARKLAAARRIKARHCISHIAFDLNELPGPQILPRDVVQFIQSRGFVT